MLQCLLHSYPILAYRALPLTRSVRGSYHSCSTIVAVRRLDLSYTAERPSYLILRVRLLAFLTRLLYSTPITLPSRFNLH